MWDYPKWGIQEGLKEGFWELTDIGEKWTGWRSSLAKVPLKWHRTLLIDISVHTEVIFCWTKTKSGQEPTQCVFKSLERGLGETNSIQAFLHSVFSNQILGARSGSTEGETDSLFDFSPICVSKSNQIKSLDKTVVWVRLTLLQRFSSVCVQIKSRPWSGSLFDFSPLCVFKSNQIKSNQIKSNQIKTAVWVDQGWDWLVAGQPFLTGASTDSLLSCNKMMVLIMVVLTILWIVGLFWSWWSF